MPPILAAVSFGYGVAFGLLKIAWIVLPAVFLYDISVETGQFEIMKESIAGITPDRRLQVLLVAFCFGAFIEGAAGFGAPVAIAGAFMIGLGFRPFHAAALNLIANTAPVAWGSVGVPIHTLAAVCGLPESDLSATIGRILPHHCGDCPFLAGAHHGRLERDLRSVSRNPGRWVPFALIQFFWSNYMDSSLVDIMGAVVSIVATVAFLRFWRPKKIWRFDYDETSTPLLRLRQRLRMSSGPVGCVEFREAKAKVRFVLIRSEQFSKPGCLSRSCHYSFWSGVFRGSNWR